MTAHPYGATALDDAPAAPAAMGPGARLGAYRVIAPIGRGGMGAVWLAEHAMLGRRAAIKVLHRALSANEEIVARFFNEARAATAIADPGIVQVFDFGHAADGSAYIVMELLDGEPLDRRLGRVGALAIGDALRIVRQAASSLAAAHARGIVHRDLKPENLFLVRDPEVDGGERAKLLDFGIAKLSDDPGAHRTQTAAVMGTPLYMAPEQCRGAGAVDARADLYSLGCVLFELLAGSPPFIAEGAGELMAMHMLEPAPAPSSRRPGVPPEIDRLVLRCLAKRPEERFASAAELAAAIGAIVGAPRGPVYKQATAIGSLQMYAAVPALTPAVPALTPVTGPGSGTPVPQAPLAGKQTTLSHAASSTAWPPRAAQRRARWPWLAGFGVLAAASAAIVVIVARTGGAVPAAIGPAAAPMEMAAPAPPPVEAKPPAPPVEAAPPPAPPIAEARPAVAAPPIAEAKPATVKPPTVKPPTVKPPTSQKPPASHKRPPKPPGQRPPERKFLDVDGDGIPDER